MQWLKSPKGYRLPIKPSTAVDQHTFRTVLDQIDMLSPRQIEELLGLAQKVRGRKSASAEIEARTEQEHSCPNCGGLERQRWGTTRTGAQRYRCSDCGRSFSGLTNSAIGRVHRHDRFLEAVRDMMTDRPLSCRKLAAVLGCSKDTIWRWRMVALEALGQVSDTAFSGIVEADEAFQRESLKGSLEWVLHQSDPEAHPKPDRYQWYRYKSGLLKMKRGLSRYQLPLLTVMDRSGRRFLERIPNRSVPVIEQALAPIISNDAVLCSDGAKAYARFSSRHNLPHYVLSTKPTGPRVINGAFHIQTINSLHSQYGNFIRPFCGPASKYLYRYLRWFLIRSTISPTEAFRRILAAPC